MRSSLRDGIFHFITLSHSCHFMNLSIGVCDKCGKERRFKRVGKSLGFRYV